MTATETPWVDWRQKLFDPLRVPFSHRGSFLAISHLHGDGAFWLRNLRGGDEETDHGRMLRLVVIDREGSAVPGIFTLAPDCLTISDGSGGKVLLCFDGPERICVAATGLGLRLEAGPSKYNYAQQAGNGIHVCIARQDMRCEVTAKRGLPRLSAPWNGLSSDRITIDIMADDGTAEATLAVFRMAPSKVGHQAFAEARKAAAADFRRFADLLPPAPAALAAGRLLAAYILWSAYVPAEGALSLPAIYMSKNWMTNIWSWDHCFVALSLAEQQPQAAFEQMAVIFNAQHDSGRLPDFINDRFAYWSFSKPPVHGWTFAKLRHMAPAFYDHARMAKVVHWLERQVNGWLSGPSRGGLPAYRHGNDAGWDNATLFSAGGPVVTPDLATLIILQLAEIAALHRALGNIRQATEAASRAEELCSKLFESLWVDGRFVARLQVDGAIVEAGDSLLAFMPLLLGERLPAAMRDALLRGLLRAGRFVTDHGLASEALDSPYYRSDGYWRGPIWAPSTMLLVDGLERCGEPATARDMARRFCAMANRSGMAENYDAVSGAGLCDPAFAWTSSVFLVLAAKLKAKPSAA